MGEEMKGRKDCTNSLYSCMVLCVLLIISLNIAILTCISSPPYTSSIPPSSVIPSHPHILPYTPSPRWAAVYGEGSRALGQVRQPIIVYPLCTLYTPSLPHLHLCTPVIHVYTIYTPLTTLNTLYTSYIHPIYILYTPL